MFRLLIVDDEPIIVDGLYERFAELRMHQLDVYKAYSGTEALLWLNRKKIDVVITDIKMPGIDGMQLLERIRQNWPACKVIFLTGHDKFEYVYKAIQYGGVSYLLKTEGYDNIIELVQKYLEEIRKGLRDEELLQQAKLQLQRSIPLLQREFLSELVESGGTQVAQAQLDELGIPMSAEHPVILVTGMLSDNAKRDAMARKADHYKVHLIVEGQLSRHATIVGTSSRSHMLWLLQIRRDAEQEWSSNAESAALYLKGVLENAQSVCAETFSLGVSFAVSGTIVRWDEIAEEFGAHKAMLASAGQSGMEVVLSNGGPADGRPQGQGKPGSAWQGVKAKLKKVETLEAYLEQGRRDEFAKTLKEIQGALALQPGRDLLYTETFYSISLVFLSYLNHRGGAASAAVDTGRLTRIDGFSTPQQAFRFFGEAAQALFDLQNVEQESRSAAAVQRVQKHILDNPGGDLSLSTLADMVYFNPKYLSRLFKQVTGVNLSDYILDVKLTKVKEMLRKNTMKVHEIGEFIGYYSAPCFTRFFKKAVGMTPQEYRDVNL